MKTKITSFSLGILTLGLLTWSQMGSDFTQELSAKYSWLQPLSEELAHEDDDEDEEHQWNKIKPWTAENAAEHQALLAKYSGAAGPQELPPGAELSYAGGELFGSWSNRGAYNMPGAFKFAEMLDGTDTIFGVTHNHYSGEYNSKSYIFKGTVYNPKTGTQGDDFVRLTGHWPNRYQDLIAIKVSGQTRLIAGIENGPVYYSDDEGKTWNLSSGLGSNIKSTIVNRQDNNKIYATDGFKVSVSTNGGESFSDFQNFGSFAQSGLYSPRYTVQSNANQVHLLRGSLFYTLSAGGSSFTQKGTLNGMSSNSRITIGGDSRTLYVAVNNNYWVSTNQGTSWTTKSPAGNYYGDKNGKMSSGKYLAVHPEMPDTVIGGYVHPIYSYNALTTSISTDAGWGRYQNGTGLSNSAYYDRIRFNYHPDIQSSHFFYNSTNDLFSVIATDGGMFVSYKAWLNASNTTAPDNTNSYSQADFININTLGTTCPLIYRDNLFTGALDETHYYYSTQDQGTQNVIRGETGTSLSVHQSIGGDGPPLKSADGYHVWKWQREGKQVWAPVDIYDNSNLPKSAGSINGGFGSKPSITLPDNSHIGWIVTHIDQEFGDKHIWLQTQNLEKITWNGSSLSRVTIDKGTGNHVAAVAQAWIDPNKMFFLQEGKVYRSTNRGDSFDNGTATPMTKTYNGYNQADIGGGWVLPTNDNWILFNGPSANSVGSILSKDGGLTWTDVTGNYPTGSDLQTGAMIGTPDGKYVFAGTDIGPWVFIVSTETWHPIDVGSAKFNAMDVEYIASTNTVRFGTWGSGVWDFKIEDIPTQPFVEVTAPNGGETFLRGETVNITWNGFYEGAASVQLYRNGSFESEIGQVASGVYFYAWTVPNSLTLGDQYSLRVSASTSAVNDESDATFSIESPTINWTSNFSTTPFIKGLLSTVEWNTNISSNVKVELYQGNVLIENLGALAGTVGSFNWTPADSLVIEGNYQLKLTSIEDPSVVATTPFFGVTEAFALNQSLIEVIDVTSEHNATRDADSTIDGLTGSLWHTEWSPGNPDFPHAITYRLDAPSTLVGFSHLPRQDGSTNGRIKDYKVEVSQDGNTWNEVINSSFADVSTETKVLFDEYVETSYVRFTALSEQSGSFYASMAEFNLYYVDEEPTVFLTTREINSEFTMNLVNPRTLFIQAPVSGIYSLEVVNTQGQVIQRLQKRLVQGDQQVLLNKPIGESQALILRVNGPQGGQSQIKLY